MSWSLWIRAESEGDAERQGRAWADAEPRLTFRGIVSLTPHPDFDGVWTVVVAADEIPDEQPTLGLSGMTGGPR